MEYFAWDAEKNEVLRRERGVSFEEGVFHIENGDLLDVIDQPNSDKYPRQKMYVVRISDYAFLIPFMQNGDEVFLRRLFRIEKLPRCKLETRAEEDYIG